MKLTKILILTAMLLIAARGDARSDEHVREIKVMFRDYGHHMTEGRMQGSMVIPLVFKMNGKREIVSMIAGTVKSRDSTDYPPKDDELVKALQNQTFWGFTEQQSRKYPALLRSLADQQLKPFGETIPESGAVVLIRFGDSFVTATQGAGTFKDVAWEKVLRKEFGSTGSSEKLIVIQLEADAALSP